MAVRGQPLGAQRSVEAQAELAASVGRVFGRGLLLRQTARETPALSKAVAAPTPTPTGWGGGRATLGEELWEQGQRGGDLGAGK